MTNTIQIDSKHLGRITGLVYFVIICCGLYGALAVRGEIVDTANATQTAENLLAQQSSYRIGFLCDLIMVISDVIISILCYFLLRHVSQALALAAMVFRLIQSSILGVNLIHLFHPLLLLKQSSGDTESLGQSILHQLELFDYGYLISGVFFAVNCLLMGILLYKSSLFPKLFGFLLAFAAAGYFFNCMAHFVCPQWINASEIFMFFTAVIAELSFCIYLLVWGARSSVLFSIH